MTINKHRMSIAARLTWQVNRFTQFFEDRPDASVTIEIEKRKN